MEHIPSPDIREVFVKTSQDLALIIMPDHF